jgi:hypothetical protein
MTDDDVVRAAFEELKAENLREHSSFDDVLARSTTLHARLHTSPVFRLAAAGVVIAVVATTYASFSAKHQRFTVPSEVVALGAWRPATDALLPSNSSPLGAAPALGRSILDLDTLTTGAFR